MPVFAPSPRPDWTQKQPWASLLSFLPSTLDPADYVNPIAMAEFLPSQVVKRLIERLGKGEGEVLGKGVDFVARKLSDPEVGDVVVKFGYGLQGSTLAGSGTPVRKAAELADLLHAFVPPTQVVREGGRTYVFQPYVEPAFKPLKEQYNVVKRLLRALDEMAAEKGIRLYDLSPVHNVIYGKARGRTRPWIVDLGTLSTDKPGEYAGVITPTSARLGTSLPPRR
jgi:hypothetical protein